MRNIVKSDEIKGRICESQGGCGDKNRLAKASKVYSGSSKSWKNLYRFYSACRQTILFCLSPDDFIHLEGRDGSDITGKYLG